MTCIIGFSDGGHVHMMGDSGGFDPNFFSKTVRKDEKVFVIDNGRFLVGFAGSFRLGQILRYQFSPPAQPEGMGDMQYLVSYFIEELRLLLRDRGYSKISENQESLDYGTFMIGFHGKLYTIDPDFHVGISMDSVDAIGCGALFVLSAWDAADNIKNVKKRMLKSLQVTEHRCTMICEPFVYGVI